jgi:CRP-like cAMP-binding protein
MQLLQKGNIIYHERNRISGIYCVNKGIVKLYKTGIDGREKIIRFAQAGEIIGFRSILSQELADTTAKVIEDAVLCFIPANLFIDLVKENNEFSMEVLKVSLKELGEANKFIIDIAQKTVRERLAEILVLLRDTFDLDEQNYLKVSLTREELANLVGTATESVIRLLSEFKTDKYIELNGRKIRILKLDSLKKLARIK